MTEHGQPLSPEEYRQEMWRQAQIAHEEAEAEAERGSTFSQSRDSGAAPQAGAEESQPQAEIPAAPAWGRGAHRAPAAAGQQAAPQLPQMQLPQIPVTDFSRGVSYGLAAGVVLGGLVAVYLLNRSPEEGGGAGSGQSSS